MADARTIWLNGTSSSGKSTLAKEMQSELEKPFLHVKFDTFVRMLPPKTLLDQKRLAEQGPMVIDGFHATIRALVNAGNSVIVDNLFERRESLLHACQVMNSG